jgi:hypothetical protein
MRGTIGTISDLSDAIKNTLIELRVPASNPDGTIPDAVARTNALLAWWRSYVKPADGTLPEVVESYNKFIRSASYVDTQTSSSEMVDGVLVITTTYLRTYVERYYE